MTSKKHPVGRMRGIVTLLCIFIPLTAVAAEPAKPLAIDYTFPENTPVHVIRVGMGVIKQEEPEGLQGSSMNAEKDKTPAVSAPPPPPPPPLPPLRGRGLYSNAPKISWQRNKLISDVKVAVQPSKAPFILALISHNKVRWHIDNQAGENLKAVIVGGREYGEATGLAAGTPVLHSRLMKNSTLIFRLEGDLVDNDLLLALETITNNKVANYESFMRKESVTVNADRKMPAFPSNAELHVVSAEDGSYSEERAQQAWDAVVSGKPDVPGITTLQIEQGNKPIVLALDGTNPILWEVDNPHKRDIAAIVLSGGREQDIAGIDKKTLIIHRNFRLGYHERGGKDYSPQKPMPFTYIVEQVRKYSGIDVGDFARYAEQITGLEAASIQNADNAQRFDIGLSSRAPLFEEIRPIEELKPNPEARVYAIGMHSGKEDFGYDAHKMHVYIPQIEQPVRLLLTTINPNRWVIHNPHGVKIDSVVFSGVLKQEFTGLDESTQVFYRHGGYFAYDNPIELQHIAKTLFGEVPYEVLTDTRNGELMLKD